MGIATVNSIIEKTFFHKYGLLSPNIRIAGPGPPLEQLRSGRQGGVEDQLQLVERLILGH